MARIFISHSSANNAEALALRDWLVARGWDDLFLDIDPQRGLVSGQRWLAKLQESAQRCKAVVVVLSRAWLASGYCRAEYWEATKVERPLFAVLVDDTAIDDIPAELRGIWQLATLSRGSRFEAFSVQPPPDYAAQTVRFSYEGLENLRLGLHAAGLTGFDTWSFPWPAPGCELEADGTTPRRPYRGLKPLDLPDAGIFFGRDADLVRARDSLAELHERGSRCLVVLLGASGSGKSSFLRAGLLPRLGRDDRRFLPLPVVRPRGAPLWGDEGLLAAIESAHRKAGLAVARAELRREIEAGGAGYLRRLADLRAAAASGLSREDQLPTLVLPLDQAEELFTSQQGDQPGQGGSAEEELFLARLAELVRHGPKALVVATIRSDAYEPLQSAPALAGVPQVPFNLPPIAAADYREVVEGPARRAGEAGRPLSLEPGLAANLLADALGADALPLLGFTLERLYLEYGGGGALSQADYVALGRVQGSIEAAVAEAFADPEARPRIPATAAEREEILKRAFVPHLMGVHEGNGEPVRRTARRQDLPAEAQGLIERLVSRRLLVVDRRGPELAGRGEAVVEVAHEALLRRWPTLRRWHDQERVALETQQEIARAASGWGQNARGADWLAHRGARLAEAEAVALRPDFAAVFAGEPRAYLDACRQAEDAAHAAEAQRLARQRRLQQRAGLLLLIVALVTLAGAGLVVRGQRNVARRTAMLITAGAREALAAGLHDRALRLALAASRGSWLAAPSPDAGIQLGRAAHSCRLEARLTSHTRPLTAAAFGPSGDQIVTASEDGTARLWSRGRDGVWLGAVLAGHRGAVLDAAFSPDGRQIATAAEDQTVRLWSRGEDGDWRGVPLQGHRGVVNAVAFSPAENLLATASEDGTARVWSRSAGGAWTSATLTRHEGSIDSVYFSPDGTQLLTLAQEETAVVWSRGTNGTWRPAILAGHTDWPVSAAFSPDGRQLATASFDKTARVWSRTQDGAWRATAVLQGHTADLTAIAFSPDGARIVTGASDATARVWSRDGEGAWRSVALEGHRGGINEVAFFPDGLAIVTASQDGTARVWSQGEDGVWQGSALQGHEGGIVAVSFSPDGSRILTASEDGTAGVWARGDDGGWRSVPLRGHRAGVSRAAFSPDGARVVTASTDHTARVWSRDRHGRFQDAVLEGHQDRILSASFSPDGRRIVTASWDQTARVWSQDRDGRWTSDVLAGHRGRLVGATFSPDGRSVATTAGDNTARVWTQGTGGRWSAAVLGGHTAAVLSAVFAPNGTYLVTASNENAARVWSRGPGATWTGLPLVGHRLDVLGVALSPDGRLIATASEDGTARVWSRGADGAWNGLPLEGHQGPVERAAFSPDSLRVATASADKTARVWSRGANGIWRGVPLAGHQGAVTTATFSPDGSRVLTSSLDDTARIWSQGEDGTWSGAPLQGHRGAVWSASFSRDGLHVVTASEDHTARLWDVRWLQGPEAWAKTERRPLPEVACRERLHGSWTTVKDPKSGRLVRKIAERLLTAGDIRAAPILAGREGEDVCEPFLNPKPWWRRLAFWR